MAGHIVIEGNTKGKKKCKQYLRVGMTYTLLPNNTIHSETSYLYGARKKNRIRIVNTGATIKKLVIPDECEELVLSSGFSRGMKSAPVFNESCKPAMPLHIPSTLKSLDIHMSANISNLEEALHNEDLTINLRATNG